MPGLDGGQMAKNKDPEDLLGLAQTEGSREGATAMSPLAKPGLEVTLVGQVPCRAAFMFELHLPRDNGGTEENMLSVPSPCSIFTRNSSL